MRRIVVHRRHSLGRAGARRLVETTAERLREEHGGTFQWDGNTLRFQRPGASGHVALTDDDVEVRVDLGLLLVPLRARIAREIDAFLDEQLGADVAPDRGQPARRAATRSAETRSSRSQGTSRSVRPK